MKMLGFVFGTVKNFAKLFRKWRVRRRRRRATAARVDFWVLRWLLMVPILLLVLTPFNPLLDWKKAFFGSYFGYGILLALYGGHLLLFRLQSSLLEWLLMLVFLGSVVGSIVSVPAFHLAWMPLTCLASVFVGWVLYGAVIGIVQADLLGVDKPAGRIALLVLGWLTTAAPGMLSAAYLVFDLGRVERWLMVSHSMAAWILPLAGLGLLGLAADAYLTWRCWRAAKKILGEGPLRDEPPPGGPVDRSGGMKVYG